MDRYEVPDWVPSAMQHAEELTRAVAPYVEQVQRAAEIAESMMPAFRYAQQVLDVARSAAPIVEFIQRYGKQAQQALEAAAQLFAYYDRTALAIAGSTTAPQTWTASATLAVTPTLTAEAEAVETAGSGEVNVQPDTRPEARSPIDYGAMAIRLLWTWALVMPPLAVFRLPLDVQQMLLFYAAGGGRRYHRIS